MDRIIYLEKGKKFAEGTREGLLEQSIKIAEKVEGFLGLPEYSTESALKDCYRNYINTYLNSLSSEWRSLWTKKGREVSSDGTEWDVYSLAKGVMATNISILFQFPAIEVDDSFESMIEQARIAVRGLDGKMTIVGLLSCGEYEAGERKGMSIQLLPDPAGGATERSPLQILGIRMEMGSENTILKIPTNKSLLNNWEKLKKAVDIKGQEISKYYDDLLLTLKPDDTEEIERVSLLSANAKSWASRIGSFDIVPSIGIEGDMEYAKAYIDGKIIFSDDKERVHDLGSHIFQYVYNKLISALKPEIKLIDDQFRNDLRKRYNQVLESEKKIVDPQYQNHPEIHYVKKYLPIMKSYMGVMADVNSNFILVSNYQKESAPFITKKTSPNGAENWAYNELYLENLFNRVESVLLNGFAAFPTYYFPRVYNNELLTSGSFFPIPRENNLTTVNDFIRVWKI